MKIECWVEGATDTPVVPLIRGVLRKHLPVSTLDDLLPRDSAPLRLSERVQRRYAFRKSGQERSLKLSARGQKILGEIARCRRDHPDTFVVAIWDQDGNAENVRDRDHILGWLRDNGVEGAAVGVCIQEIEAWLIADMAAFRGCFGQGPSHTPTDPEDDDDPKATLHRLFEESYEIEGDYPEHYRKLAEHIKVDELAKRCPKGFGVFQEALEELLLPVLTTYSTHDGMTNRSP